MTKKWFVSSGCALALQLVACSGSGNPDGWAPGDVGGPARAPTGEAREPIVGGKTDSSDTAVLAIALVTRKEEALCSGSLIAPNLVLTARHCVAVTASTPVVCGQSMFGSLYSPGDLWVSDAATAGSGNFYPAREIAVPSNDTELCGSDVALLILDGQFRAGAVSPLAPRLDQPVRRGESFSAIGFGDGLDAGPVGVRRTLDGLRVLCGPNDCADPQLVSDREFVGQQGVCDGDSGGPALDAEGRVVGVASRAAQGCELAVYSAVAPWRDWILSVADRAAQLGTYDVPEWESSGPMGAPAASAGGMSSGGVAPSPSPAPPAPTPPALARDSTIAEGPAKRSSSGSGCDLTAGAATQGTSNIGYPAWLAAIALAGAWRRRYA